MHHLTRDHNKWHHIQHVEPTRIHFQSLQILMPNLIYVLTYGLWMGIMNSYTWKETLDCFSTDSIYLGYATALVMWTQTHKRSCYLTVTQFVSCVQCVYAKQIMEPLGFSWLVQTAYNRTELCLSYHLPVEVRHHVSRQQKGRESQRRQPRCKELSPSSAECPRPGRVRKSP